MKKRLRKKFKDYWNHPRHHEAERNWQPSFNGCMNLEKRLEAGEFDYRAWLRLAKQIRAEWNVGRDPDDPKLETWLNPLTPIKPQAEELAHIAGDLGYYSDRWYIGRFYRMHLLMRRYRDTYGKGQKVYEDAMRRIDIKPILLEILTK